MHWDDTNDEVFEVSDDIVDVAFRIRCPRLPLDHAYPLQQALMAQLPWLESDDRVGIHPIYGAASGHGWERPSDPDTDVLHLSKRTRMILRVPKERVAEVCALSGTTLRVMDNTIDLGEPTTKPLRASATLFARRVATTDYDSEEDFLSWAATRFAEFGVDVRRLLCGRHETLRTPHQEIKLCSLMLSSLTFEESVQVQQNGLGDHRQLGCGIFVPYKDIGTVRSDKGRHNAHSG